jgi:glycosyltransferase involved in cell wall biosynthesis
VNVALAHEYFAAWGGAEQVVRELHGLWPDAPVYTLFAEDRHGQALAGWDLRTSWMQRLPLGDGRHRLLLPLLPRAVESIEVAPVDVLVSSSSAFIKGLRLPDGARHVCYCHAPTRYLWDWSEQYVRDEVPLPLRPVAAAVLVQLRDWDLAAARRVDRFIANSRTVQERIRRYYGHDAEVVYPPVDVVSFELRDEREDFYLMVSRLVRYKNVDIAVRAFNSLGLRLKIVGEGRDRGRLERLAKDHVEFLGRQPDEHVRELLAVARGLVFPAEDDFGIVCVEALASGRPVIALARGGATEIVDDGLTGMLFDTPTPEALTEALGRAERARFDPGELRRSASRFDVSVFRERVRAIVAEMVA